MRFSARHGRRSPIQLDITPMIDVVFQLVLFFVVTTNFVTHPYGIQVDLPRAGAEILEEQPEVVDVWMSRAGEIVLDGAPVDLAGLTSRLRQAAARSPETLVIIQADAEIGHGRVVMVMDIARSLGLTRIAIATEPLPVPADP